jgi:uncharacterized protein (TIGR03084 family)
MPDMYPIFADLKAEHDALDAIVAGLVEGEWIRQTPAPGWTIADLIGHLAHYDEVARLALIDPDCFRAFRDSTTPEQEEQRHLARGRRLESSELVARWRTARAALLAALRPLEPKQRIAWFGPAMGALSFATARLMETWAHGQDVADALGLTRAPTERLRQIAHLGVLARPYSYAAHRRMPPTADIRVELTGPTGQHWTWGSDSTADRVAGTAYDFCLVVTQRRHLADTDLATTGSHAQEWLAIAQAFAGPPGLGRQPGQFPHGGCYAA